MSVAGAVDWSALHVRQHVGVQAAGEHCLFVRLCLDAILLSLLAHQLQTAEKHDQGRDRGIVQRQHCGGEGWIAGVREEEWAAVWWRTLVLS